MSERLEDDKAYIRLFNQNTKLSKRVKELEESLEHGTKVAVKTAEKLHYEQQQNKRYRELLLKIFKVTQNHQIEKISDYAFSRAGMLFYEWLGASGAIDLDRYCDEVNGHDNYDEYNIERMIDKMIKARKTLGESE